jgi:hypothetical protein
MTTITLTPRPTPGALVTDPRMDDTNYGVPVSAFGDGDAYIALGHHPRRRIIAALNKHSREFPCWLNLADDRTANAQERLDRLDYRWATFNIPDPARNEDPDCDWWVHWATPDTPGAQPVTLLPA